MTQKKKKLFKKSGGRFDASMISSSSEKMMDEDMTEEVEAVRSNKKNSMYLGKRKSATRSSQVMKTTRGKTYNEKAGEIS